MKKVVSIILALALSLTATACGNVMMHASGGQASNNKTNTIVVSAENGQEEDTFPALKPMMEPLKKFVEYNLIMNNTIDYGDIISEDFWNIVALAVCSYEDTESIAEIDAGGLVHVRWNDGVDIAKTFMYDYWHRFSAPAIKSSYATSADPGSGILDFVPLDVNNYDASVVSVEDLGPDSGDNYAVFIDLEDRDETRDVYHYVVYLDSWSEFVKANYNENDEGGHILPYVVSHFDYLGYDEVKAE